jgi:hypothetical protein
MSRYTSVINNETTGHIGDIVYAHWNGKKIIRAYCPHYNQALVTPAQTAQRSKFRPLRSFAYTNIPMINEIFPISPQNLGRKESFLKWLLDITNIDANVDLTKCNYMKVGNGREKSVGLLSADDLIDTPNIRIYPTEQNAKPYDPLIDDEGDALLINENLTKAEIQFGCFSPGTPFSTLINDSTFDIDENIIILTRDHSYYTSPVDGTITDHTSPFSTLCIGSFNHFH